MLLDVLPDDLPGVLGDRLLTAAPGDSEAPRGGVVAEFAFLPRIGMTRTLDWFTMPWSRSQRRIMSGLNSESITTIVRSVTDVASNLPRN